MRFWNVAFVLGLTAIWPVGASAHLGLTSPTSRYGPDVLKTGPCGTSGGQRTGNVTTYEPGETIEVSWEEYIDHPGHYRIAFDEDGDDDFVDPSTMMELYSNDAVLLDGIADQGAAERDYLVTVTLPDVTCDNCTLQVIQVMYDKPPYTTPGNDIYYQCADLVLRTGSPPTDGGTDAGTDAGNDAGAGTDAGLDPGADPIAPGGCSVASGAPGGPGWISALLVLGCLLARERSFPL